MNAVRISFVVKSTDANCPLHFRAGVNQEIFVDQMISQAVEIQHEFVPTTAGPQNFWLELVDKDPQYTKIDVNNKIIHDVLLCVDQIKIDGFGLQPILQNIAQYQHNFNGHGPDTVEKFFNVLGCAGTVKIAFSTPTVNWLLENI